MEKEKIDRVIDAFRSAMYQEFSVSEDVPTNSASGGQVAGLPPDQPPVKLDGRKKYVKKYVDQLMKKRKKREDKKNMRKVMDFNPYFSDGRKQ
jgi:hypothetical protein|tara:strand:+ start:120 stop:398 length:279 start_codon:yes stop_codon:yes gene_type:complete